MKYEPRVVDYNYWNIILKCKSNMSKQDCFMSIWTKEYANDPKYYSNSTMVIIMKQAIDEIFNEHEKSMLFNGMFNYFTSLHCSFNNINSESILDYLYDEFKLLKVRDNNNFLCEKNYDLFIIKKDDKYYNIKEYDEIFDSENKEFNL